MAFESPIQRVMEEAMKRRRRIEQSLSLEERLAEEAERLRKEARTLPPGQKQEILLHKVRQDEVAVHLTAWLTSPGLQPPK
jgi:hypothetical protein